MALYDLIYNKNFPLVTPVTLGEGLSSFPNRYVTTSFGVNGLESGIFNFSDLAYISKFTTPVRIN